MQRVGNNMSGTLALRILASDDKAEDQPRRKKATDPQDRSPIGHDESRPCAVLNRCIDACLLSRDERATDYFN